MTLRLVLRYAAFQLPELAIVGFVLLLVRQWDLLSVETAGLIFVLWVAKDGDEFATSLRQRPRSRMLQDTAVRVPIRLSSRTAGTEGTQLF
jgi:hypothetical protein